VIQIPGFAFHHIPGDEVKPVVGEAGSANSNHPNTAYRSQPDRDPAIPK